ncbi:Pyrrolidone-carboxylate peptidase [Rosistilla ulvae]|uniref:Pyrrolidone-carboxylate peptidase n=1 Tax=Rosistilla ulvae TaxID=1930277 RepID=A0A517M5M9_9BACT|nr:pyroglutamyl-peptidase I [Rosistilla ulvae]QDS90171.1 Pyrrolidone-carboxylate peptidase [Rosistilla ulvae]
MPRVLLTAFEPYEEWQDNSSWLTLVELTRWFDAGENLVTRRYPVDFQAVKHRLAIDMQQDFDLILHLGQAPGASVMRLEGFAINMGSNHCALVDDGPAAHRSRLPLTAWSNKLQERGIPAQVSYHAGTYLCNATLYMSQHYAAHEGLRTDSTFIHLPVSPHQVAARQKPMPSMSVPLMAAGIALILEQYLQRSQTA